MDIAGALKDISGVDQLLYDTREFAPDERFDRWRVGITDFAVEELETDRPFDGRSLVTGLGSILISESELPPLRFVRDRAMILADGHDHWTLSLVLEGSLSGHADGVPFHIGPGELLLLSHERPSEVVGSRGRTMVFAFPHDAFKGIEAGAAHGPLAAGAESELLVGFLRLLSSTLAGLGPTSVLQVARALCTLVTACLPTAGAQPVVSTRRQGSLRKRLIAHVEANIDRDIDVDRLGEVLNTSRSALYRACKRDGGINSLVRRVRLEAAHRILSDQSQSRTIQEVARLVGFTESSLFSRQFRAAFGYTAAEFRRRLTVPSALPGTSNDAAESFRSATYRLASGPNAG